MSFLEFNCRYRYPSGFEIDLNFDAGTGVTVLFGPSGSGKTTVLSLIAGILRPAEGKIKIDQVVTTDVESGVFLLPEQRQLGVLFQDNRLFPHLKVRDNISYGFRRRKNGATVSREQVIEVLELKDLLDRYPATLSGGQMQRVGLARAILAGPKMLLLDEPLNSIEAQLRESISGLIQRVVDQFDIPVLLISHDANLVERFTESVIALENGRILAANSTL